jgi:DNA-binding GntR family transcriptional regulator
MAPNDAVGKSASTHDYLKDQAIKGRLRPGRHLSPVDLAGQLRISVTPIRDALVRLTEEGYLTFAATRGYFTKPFSVDEQRDLLRLLWLSVVPALFLAERAAARCALQGLLDLPRDGDVTNPGISIAITEAAARRFEGRHIALAEATGNTLLVRQSQGQIDRTHLVRRLDLGDPANRRAEAAHLSALAQEVLSEDLTGAFAAARRHLAELEARLPALVALANSQALQSDFP